MLGNMLNPERPYAPLFPSFTALSPPLHPPHPASLLGLLHLPLCVWRPVVGVRMTEGAVTWQSPVDDGGGEGRPLLCVRLTERAPPVTPARVLPLQVWTSTLHRTVLTGRHVVGFPKVGRLTLPASDSLSLIG